MLEFINTILFPIAMGVLILFILNYFIDGQPLKESVEHALFMGIFLMIALKHIDQSIIIGYQLIVRGIVLGIAIFSLKTVFGYYVFKRSLKKSVKDGLINGGIAAILFPIVILDTRDILIFLYDLIV